MAGEPPIPAMKTCACGSQLAPTLLACPSCGRLVHAVRLEELAKAAREAAGRGDGATEIEAWREALDLLPTGTRQHAALVEKIGKLGGTLVGASSSRASGKGGSHAAPKWLAGLGMAGLLIWKFKFIAVLVATKGKLLLLGLTKSSTLFSMLLSLGVYWTAWGWKFALGIVLSIYIHEMGHVAELRRLGFKATAPMFIPGIGALIRLQQHPANAREDARIGLAGPIWGLGAALGSLALGAVFEMEIFLAIARVGAWINLFNLLPIWSLDGGRAFRPMSRVQRWLMTLAIGAAWVLVKDGVLLIVLIGGVFRSLADKGDEKGDWSATAWYAALLAALSAMVYFVQVQTPV